ncbi:hypothetical protein GCM10009844_26530 [Nocardioides koreensis]|uniref:Integral membrane protein n=1 Tax=Nocardioides koreensis TaxID=433651 RepID=A0ABP5LNS4_9ACTN
MAAAPPPTAPMAAAPTAPPASPPVLPPPPAGPPPTAGPATPRLPSVSWQRLLVGNWLGAGLTAATALVAAGVLSTVLGLMSKPVDFGVDNGLTLVTILLAATFGADLVLDLDTGGDTAHANVGMFPLTVTILALVAAAFVFRRVTARYPRALDAVADAARAALLLGLGVMVLAVVFRADNNEMGRGWGAVLSRGRTGVDAEWGASIAGAFFLAFLVLFVTLVAVLFATRRDWWPAPVKRVHDWTAAPLYGVGTIFAMLPVAGVVGLLLLIFTGDTLGDNDPTDDDLSAGIALIVGLVASGGFWLISLGAGAAYGSVESGSGSSDTTDLHHLAHYAQDTPGLWAAPVVMLVVLFLAAFTVARKTAAPQRILGNLGVFVALLLVALPLMSRLTSMHAGARLDGEDLEGSYYIGQVGWQATLLLALTGLVCAGLVALMSRSINPAAVRAQASALAGRMQSNPGRPPATPPAAPTGPPPSWQPGATEQEIWGRPTMPPPAPDHPTADDGTRIRPMTPPPGQE